MVNSFNSFKVLHQLICIIEMVVVVVWEFKDRV